MDRLPPLWTDSAGAQIFLQQLRTAPQSLLMLDYDGTLAPFHQDRMQAVVYPGIEERLLTLSALPNLHLVLVTGRSARELRGLLHPGMRVDIWGSHGRELLQRNQSYQLFALDPAEQATLQRVIEEMIAAGFGQTLEIKPTSLAVHWRSCEPALQEKINALVEALFQSTPQAGRLHLLPFDGGVELRSSERNKGTAVRAILSREADPLPAAYLGDDLTDEDAFIALGGRGLSLLVRSDARNSHADYWLRPPEELLAFLDDWIAACSSQIAAASMPAETPQ